MDVTLGYQLYVVDPYPCTFCFPEDCPIRYRLDLDVFGSTGHREYR